MGLEYCKACKREVTPKFKFWLFLATFIIIPVLVYYINQTLYFKFGFYIYLFLLIMAVSGYFRACPICNTPINPTIKGFGQMKCSNCEKNLGFWAISNRSYKGKNYCAECYQKQIRLEEKQK